MKKHLQVCFFVIFHLSVCAQYKVFSENMGNVSVGASTPTARTYTGFENYNQNGITYGADIGSTATVRSTVNSSSGYTTASGENFVNIAGNASAYFSINNIPVTNGTGLQLSFGVSKSLIAENGSSLTVEVVMNGNPPIIYSPTLATGSGTTQWYYVTATITIPPGNLLDINFKNTSTSTNSVAYRIDDILVTSATPLPVTFDKVQATQSNGQLKVLWLTSSETNNDHFDVEVSKNGKDFTKIATIKSKAVSGNSSTPLQYEFTTPVSAISLAAISLFLAILSIGVKNRGRQATLLFTTLLTTIFFISCQKGNIVQREAANKIFVRVAQVDIDGTKSYSKIVKVIEE